MAEFTEHTLYGGRVKIKFYTNSHQYWVSVDGSAFKRKGGSTTFIGIKDKSRPLQSWQQRITADFLLKKLEAGEPITVDLALEASIQNDILRDEASDIGKDIHSWIEAYIKHKLKVKGYESLPPIPDFPEALQGVNSFLDWEKEHKVKFRSSERIVYSLEHDYMGTLDIEAEIGKKIYLVDIKSANGLYNGVLAQTGSYLKADVEESGRKYAGRWAIRLSKTTAEEYYRQEERKKELKRAIARIKGKEFKDYEVRPFQVFEAKFLDDDETNLERDFKAFLSMIHLYRWDASTSGFNNDD